MTNTHGYWQEDIFPDGYYAADYFPHFPVEAKPVVVTGVEEVPGHLGRAPIFDGVRRRKRVTIRGAVEQAAPMVRGSLSVSMGLAARVVSGASVEGVLTVDFERLNEEELLTLILLDAA